MTVKLNVPSDAEVVEVVFPVPSTRYTGTFAKGQLYPPTLLGSNATLPFIVTVVLSVNEKLAVP